MVLNKYVLLSEKLLTSVYPPHFDSTTPARTRSGWSATTSVTTANQIGSR